MGFLAFSDTIGTGLGPSETNLEHLKSYFCSSAKGTQKKTKTAKKKVKTSFSEVETAIFGILTRFYIRNGPLDLVSLITNLKTRSLIWHFFIVKSTAGPV